MVEFLPSKQNVVGSNPTTHSKSNTKLRCILIMWHQNTEKILSIFMKSNLTGDLHNGSAEDFESSCRGSIPLSPATLYMSVKGVILEKL